MALHDLNQCMRRGVALEEKSLSSVEDVGHDRIRDKRQLINGRVSVYMSMISPACLTKGFRSTSRGRIERFSTSFATCGCKFESVKQDVQSKTFQLVE